MDRITHKKIREQVRKNRVRARVTGTKERPRLCLRLSNLHCEAQIINDISGVTLVAITTVGQKGLGKTMTERCEWLGTAIAKKAADKKIKKVVLDRGSKPYHGRVKAFAQAAKSTGLEF